MRSWPSIASGKKIRPSHITGLQTAIDEIESGETARSIFINVKDAPYSATGDGSTNDRSAIQAAIDAASSAGGGTVFFPASIYRVEIEEPGDDTHCLVIDHSYIRLLGEPGSVIDCFPYGGDPDTNWEVVDGAVWRGGGIFVTGGADYTNRRRGVRIEGLEINGNFTYTGDDTNPADITTGDGWDITHKGIWFENDTYHDNHAVLSCHIYNFSGEIIYSGGSDAGSEPVLGTFDIEDNLLHDCNGSIISVSGRWVRVLRNDIHTCYSGIENAIDEGWIEYAYNRVVGATGDAIVYIGYNEGMGGGDIHHNRVEMADLYGIGLFSAWNTKCHHNTIIDCTSSGIRQEVGSGYPNDWAQDVSVYDNLILAHTRNMAVGIGMNFNDGEARRVRVMRNTIARTEYAADNNFVIAEPYSDYPSTDHGAIEVRENAYYGTHGDSTNAAAYNELLTTTNQTTIASRKPPIEGMLLVSVSVRVITGATDVAIVITSADHTETGTSYTVQANTSLAVGSYFYPSVLIPTGQRMTCEVKVTAGTANQVYATATIREA